MRTARVNVGFPLSLYIYSTFYSNIHTFIGVFTADEGRRGGKTVKLKEVVDAAVASLSSVRRVFVFKRTGADVGMVSGRDEWMSNLLASSPSSSSSSAELESEAMDSEDPLFILYTSGSTGKPKGVAHSTAGYLLNAALTTQTSFALQEDDVYCCVADCGWITGHSVGRPLYPPMLYGF